MRGMTTARPDDPLAAFREFLDPDGRGLLRFLDAKHIHRKTQHSLEWLIEDGREPFLDWLCDWLSSKVRLGTVRTEPEASGSFYERRQRLFEALVRAVPFGFLWYDEEDIGEGLENTITQVGGSIPGRGTTQWLINPNGDLERLSRWLHLGNWTMTGLLRQSEQGFTKSGPPRSWWVKARGGGFMLGSYPDDIEWMLKFVPPPEHLEKRPSA